MSEAPIGCEYLLAFSFETKEETKIAKSGPFSVYQIIENFGIVSFSFFFHSSIVFFFTNICLNLSYLHTYFNSFILILINSISKYKLVNIYRLISSCYHKLIFFRFSSIRSRKRNFTISTKHKITQEFR